MAATLQELESSEPLQLILGTDKRNPVINVYSSEETGTLHVYYGLELMESLPDDREHFAYKLLVARLYNAGVKACLLAQTFTVDPKTMKRWGDALKKGDPEQLMDVLAGRYAERKLTLEIQGYVRMRFCSVYSESRNGYNARLREEIERIFEVRISGETLRPLLGELRAEFDSAPQQPGAEPSEQKRETACELSPPGWADGSASPALQSEPEAPQAIRKQSPVFGLEQQGASAFCHHAGVLLFSRVLTTLAAGFAEGASLLKQWLAAILLGAVNIEQSKFLDFEDLTLLLGSTVRSLHPQRTRLCELAGSETVAALLKFNLRACEATAGSDFYYDPHTKQYTGESNVLKGWCSNRRLADKALHTDFIHSADGSPLYMEWADNYHDLRERFVPNIERFRALGGFDPQPALTFIVDRGIHSIEVFKQVIDAPHLHIVTWEKGYQRGDWQPAEADGSFVLERPRNSASDLRSYRFTYIDRPWKKDPRMRRILVQATNPAGRTVEVAVLSDDLARPAKEIIRAIFWRWLQENDFKYLDKHYGINQITSYATIDYEEVGKTLEDKQIKSGQYKALEEQKRRIKTELGRLLVAQHQRARGASADSSKDGATQTKSEKRIESLDEKLKEIDTQLESTQKAVSRLETLIKAQAVRLNTNNKAVMDSLKIIARNAFYRAMTAFKIAYDNYRDDHDFFRNLTLAHGILVSQGAIIDVHLIPTTNYDPKKRRIVETMLAQINADAPPMPDGSNRTLRFFLGDKQGIKLAI